MRSTVLTLIAVATLAAVPASAAVASSARHTAAATPRAKQKCDPNYKGRCLKPNVSDYDCAGGSGDGPYYVSGPFRSVGNDHYRLDSDHDGIACER